MVTPHFKAVVKLERTISAIRHIGVIDTQAE